MSSQLVVKSGPHERIWCPVEINVTPDCRNASCLLTGTGMVLPVQHLSTGNAAFIVPYLSRDESLIVTAATHEELPLMDEPASVTAVLESPGDLAIYDDGRLVTRYRFGGSVVRPYLYPVLSPNSSQLTRSYPMQDVDGEHRDHPHHKSVWIAHGDVNGTDNWSEEAGHGGTVNTAVTVVEQGPVLARFKANSYWHDNAGQPLLSESLTVTAWHSSGTLSFLDFDIELTADQAAGDVIFGDTKEGGILSVRVASSMDGRNGGLITNVFGGRMEAECWGKPSHYCSYSGSISGGEGGIAVLERPDSFRSPVTWHVRNYGLMTANPFGLSAFTNGALNGTHTLRSGTSMKFHYRMVLHNIPRFSGNCSGMYIDYSYPPTVRPA